MLWFFFLFQVGLRNCDSVSSYAIIFLHLFVSPTTFSQVPILYSSKVLFGHCNVLHRIIILFGTQFIDLLNYSGFRLVFWELTFHLGGQIGIVREGC